MEATEVLDFDKICRLCLLEKSSMLRIFAKKKRNNTTPLPIRIMSCASLEIYQGDGLPAKICPKCLWEVNQAYTFRERCDVANTRLLQYVHNMKDGPNQQSCQAVSDQLENDIQDSAPLEYLDQQLTVMERTTGAVEQIKNEIKVEELDLKFEPRDVNGEDYDDDDDKPISSLIGYGRGRQDTSRTPAPAPQAPAAHAHHDHEDDIEAVEASDSDDVGQGDSESDLETQPASALVETEMREDEKPVTDQLTPSVAILNTPRPISVRRYLETEFSTDPTYNEHKKFYVVGSEYSKIKKKQRAVQDKPVKPGRYGRDGWEPFNLLDMKPRRKYAPREKNLISNNSSPIIEQDGTKSKFRACTHCGKVVLGKNMGIHVKIHVGNKSHLCDICGKSFLYKKTLETHKRVHSGERPCVCKICDKTFRSSSRLSDHMSTHTGRKPFICEICAVAFRIKGHLKKHLRVHSGEKPYICTFCEKAFSDAWNMKCHLRIHTGEKPPHACPVCGQCFLRRNKMEEHCKLTHGEEYVLPRKQNIVQRLKNDLIEMNDELRAISEREREDMIRQETERQLLANHFESQRQELADQLGIAVPVGMTIPLPVPAFPGNMPAGIFGLQ